MDNLSKLIKEAKPLYKQRKRRRTIAKMILGITVPILLFTSIFEIYTMGSDIYMALDSNQLQNKLLDDDFGLLGI